MAKAEETKPFNYDAVVSEVVQKIDDEKSLFTLRDELHGYSAAILKVVLYVVLASLV